MNSVCLVKIQWVDRTRPMYSITELHIGRFDLAFDVRIPAPPESLICGPIFTSHTRPLPDRELSSK